MYMIYLHFTDIKMTEHPTNEKEVMKILVEVAVARREAEIVGFVSYDLTFYLFLGYISLHCSHQID